MHHERVEKVVRFLQMDRVQEKHVRLPLGDAELGVRVRHEARVSIRKRTAYPGVEQLRIDRSTDVDKFALVRIDPNDPKLASPRLQQVTQVPLEPELELLVEGLPQSLAYLL